jgi:hypothetical protein
MKRGDLIWYEYKEGNIDEVFLGIYLSYRNAKWSEYHRFHSILTIRGGVEEFVLRIGNEHRVVVVQEIGG